MSDEADRIDAESADAPTRRTRSARRRRAAIAGAELHEIIAEAAHPAAAEPINNPTAAVPADHDRAEDRIMDNVDTAAQAFNASANDTAEQATAAAAGFNDRAQDAMARGAKMVEELNAFGKGNVEAMVESSRIAAKAAETLGQQAAEFTRKSFEDATAAMRTLAATRSPTEFMRLQGDYARQMFDAMVAETSKSTEAMLKLANDVAQPLSNRFALAAEKVRAAA